MANSRVTLIILAHLQAGPLLACKELCENEDKSPSWVLLSPGHQAPILRWAGARNCLLALLAL